MAPTLSLKMRDRSGGRQIGFHCARVAVGEWLLPEFQRPVPGNGSTGKSSTASMVRALSTPGSVTAWICGPPASSSQLPTRRSTPNRFRVDLRAGPVAAVILGNTRRHLGRAQHVRILREAARGWVLASPGFRLADDPLDDQKRALGPGSGDPPDMFDHPAHPVSRPCAPGTKIPHGQGPGRSLAARRVRFTLRAAVSLASAWLRSGFISARIIEAS